MSDARWKELYEAYGPLIYARCRKILNNEAAAEDATQETFMRAYKHLEKVRSVREALPWIYNIATHYCLNVLRDDQRQAEPQGELPERPGDNEAEVFESRQMLLRMLEQVPEKVRVAAWLHHMEGLNQGEVAQVLGVSRRTVVYWLSQLTLVATRMRA